MYKMFLPNSMKRSSSGETVGHSVIEEILPLYGTNIYYHIQKYLPLALS
jgi:hypothetical protein